MKFKRIVIIMLMPAILSGCAPKVDNEVIEFVKKTKSQKSSYVSKVPNVPQTEPFKYTAFGLRDPFVPYSMPTAEANASVFQGGPDLNRPREALETFPLDSLKMVGTIERDGIFFALLKNASGNVYRVSVGNYVGQNSGKIEKINDSEITVKEWLSSGKNGWREHFVTIPLSNKSSKTKEQKQ